MPSPIGHLLGGLAAGWLVAGVEASGDATASSAAARHRGMSLRALAFATLGTVADLDLLIGRHSQFTHSLGMTLVIGLVAYVILRARRRGPALLAVGACAAYASHVVLDWLAQDATPPRGITALWPFSSSYFLSHADVFWGISRELWRPGAAWHDVLAISRELLILVPCAVAAFWLRRRRPQILPRPASDTRQRLPPVARTAPDSESQ